MHHVIKVQDIVCSSSHAALLINMWLGEQFKGKSVIMTGAGRVIGKAIVEALNRLGATVYAISKNPDNLRALKAQCPNIHVAAVDVSNWKATRMVLERLPLADYLVNNAGVAVAAGFLETKEEDLDLIFSVNFKAVVNISQVFVQKLRAAGRPGAIVNVSSFAGLRATPGACAYSSLKAALDHLTRNMAVELAPFNIRVNAINPGPVQTDMLQEVRNQMRDKGVMLDEQLSQIPMPHKSVPLDDVVNLTLFLLSNAAVSAIGNTVAVDCGISVA